MNTPLQVKRGDSFQLSCTYKVDGQPSALSLSTAITAQLRTAAGVLVSQLVVVDYDQTEFPGRFDLQDYTTDDWPLGTLRCDIVFTTGATIQSTQSFAFQVMEGVTR